MSKLYKARGDFEITQSKGEMGAAGCMAVIRSHLHGSWSRASYPAPAPVMSWPRWWVGPAVGVVSFTCSQDCEGGRGETRFEMSGARGQLVKISSGV